MKAWLPIILSAAGAVHAQTLSRLATGYSSDSFQTRNIGELATEVSQATGGGLLIDVRPDSTLIEAADIQQAVEDGKVQAGQVIMTSLVAQVPIAGADAVPFVINSYDDAKRLWKLQRPMLEKQFEARGLKALYAVPWPPQGLCAAAPVRSPSDFRGTRMRIYNPSTLRIAQLVGASPVEVPMAQVDQAFAEDRFGNMIISAVTGVENRVWTRVNYYYQINAWYPKNIVFVSLKAFNALAAPERKALLGAAERAEARGWSMSQEAATAATNELRARGMKVGRVPADFEAEFKRMGEKLSLEWVRSVGSGADQIFVPYYFDKNP